MSLKPGQTAVISTDTEELTIVVDGLVGVELYKKVSHLRVVIS